MVNKLTIERPKDENVRRNEMFLTKVFRLFQRKTEHDRVKEFVQRILKTVVLLRLEEILEKHPSILVEYRNFRLKRPKA